MTGVIRSLEKEKRHRPVLLEEVVEFLDLENLAHLKREVRIIDATVGSGGHLLAILKFGVSVLGLDADAGMLAVAGKRLRSGKCKLVQANFKDLESIAGKQGFVGVDGILFDLGISSLHYADRKRGFSFAVPEADLDMRVDSAGQGVKAQDLLNILSEKQLKFLLAKVLKFSEAGKIAKEIVKARGFKEITTVGDLLEAISGVIGSKGRLHPATKVFLALRMAVNSELENLKTGLAQGFNLLKCGGRLAVISFHSAEDAVVKEFFNRISAEKKGEIATGTPVVPTREEVRQNPRARSAKLRVIIKI